MNNRTCSCPIRIYMYDELNMIIVCCSHSKQIDKHVSLACLQVRLTWQRKNTTENKNLTAPMNVFIVFDASMSIYLHAIHYLNASRNCFQTTVAAVFRPQSSQIIKPARQIFIQRQVRQVRIENDEYLPPIGNRTIKSIQSSLPMMPRDDRRSSTIAIISRMRTI
jgi:hypothetical protein